MDARPPLLPKLAALAVTGLLFAWISPPVNAYPLGLLAWVPALWALRGETGKRALLLGWWCGIVMNAAIFTWIVPTVEDFTNLGFVGGAAALAAFSAVWGLWVGAFALGLPPLRRAAGRFWPLAVAVWLPAVEGLNPQLFPWLQGSPWYQVPSLFLLVSLTGVTGFSFGVVLTNTLLAQLLEERARGLGGALRHAAPSLVALALWVGLAAGWSAHRLGAVAEAEAGADTLRVGLVQTNRTVHDLRKMLKKSKTAVVEDLVAASAEAFEQDGEIDVFVWPEGAIKGRPASERNQSLQDFVGATGAEVWTGAVWSRNEGDRRITHGSAFRVTPEDPGARRTPRYDKNILLPFGEFMPLRDVFPVLKKIRGVGNYARGEEIVVLEGEPADFTFLICYEATRTRYARAAVRAGADLLVNITYDGWFGDTACPHQHLMLSAIESALLGRPLVRSAMTGISAVVDARGVMTATSPLLERDVLVADVPLVAVPTPFEALGEWFLQLCVLLGAGLLLLGARREGAAGAPGAGRAWIGLVVFFAIAPMAWLINPHTPRLDYLVHGAASLAVLAAPFVRRRTLPAARSAGSPAESEASPPGARDAGPLDPPETPG